MPRLKLNDQRGTTPVRESELASDVQVDPEQDERPEHDRQHCRHNPPPTVNVGEVVVGGGDRDTDYEIDDSE